MSKVRCYDCAHSCSQCKASLLGFDDDWEPFYRCSKCVRAHKALNVLVCEDAIIADAWRHLDKVGKRCFLINCRGLRAAEMSMRIYKSWREGAAFAGLHKPQQDIHVTFLKRITLNCPPLLPPNRTSSSWACPVRA